MKAVVRESRTLLQEPLSRQDKCCCWRFGAGSWLLPYGSVNSIYSAETQSWRAGRDMGGWGSQCHALRQDQALEDPPWQLIFQLAPSQRCSCHLSRSPIQHSLAPPTKGLSDTPSTSSLPPVPASPSPAPQSSLRSTSSSTATILV